VFVGLLIAAIPIGTAPEADDSDMTILDYYTDSGNQVKQMISVIILTTALVALLVFVVGMRGLLLDAGAPSSLADLALVGGTAAVILALAGWAVGTAVPATFIFSDTFELDPDTARVVLTAGNIWLVTFAGAVGSAFVGAVSLASRRTGLFPAWLEWTGLVAAPLMLLTLPLFGLPAIALTLWVLGASIVLLLRSRGAAQQP
jgi:hypothetical protein